MRLLADYRHTLRACYLGFVTQAAVNMFSPLLFLTFQNEYHISLEKITFLVTLNFGIQLLVDLLSARFVDRIGVRPSILAAHLLSALGQLDPRWVNLGVRLLGEYSRTDDKKAALLEALKPFLKPERRARVDQAARLARLSRVAGAALRLYREEREEGRGDV